MQNKKLYYLDQKNWSSKEYYCLHRYLHRMLLHYDHNIDAIANMDIDRMSEITKVLMYCIISYYNLDSLFKLANLTDLAECKPLPEPLMLSNHGLKEERVYYRMNVLL